MNSICLVVLEMDIGRLRGQDSPRKISANFNNFNPRGLLGFISRVPVRQVQILW